jgi:hypothetical protein
MIHIYSINHVIRDAACYAAATGHLNCLKYVHELGSDLTRGQDWAMYRTIYDEHLDCLKYLLANGCNVEDRTIIWVIRWAMYNGHEDCVKYIKEVFDDIR